MHKILRYLFILLSLLVFLIIAPIIILYVSGTKLDIGNRDYKPTGIFTAITEPSKATISLNQGNSEQTPATIRFLTQGEYDVQITKDDYFDWRKRLPVESNQVTYAHEGVPAVYLVKKPQPTILAPQGVTSFVLTDNIVWFATENRINWQSISDKKPQSVQLPFTPRSISIITSNQSYLLLQNAQGKKILFNKDSKSSIVLPDTFNLAGEIFFADTALFTLIGTTVERYDISTKIISPVLTNVSGFTMLNNTAYVVFHSNKQSTLQTLDWNGTNFSASEPLLAEPLPESDTAQLIITTQKELFVLTNTVLYRVNEKLETVSAHVTNVSLDPQTRELTFRTPSELWFYNFLRSKPQLLTRSTQIVNDYLIRSALGYGFIATPEGLSLLEIDTRDQQNQYQLIQNRPVWSIAVTNNLKTSISLVGDSLVVIPLQD